LAGSRRRRRRGLDFLHCGVHLLFVPPEIHQGTLRNRITHISSLFLSIFLGRDSPRDQSPPQGILPVVLASSPWYTIHTHGTMSPKGCGGEAEPWDGGRGVEAAVGGGSHL